jgi:hypothetical protein
MSIRLSKDNHDSWRTCTTSVECKTVITVMLMVMSDMDPHMISGNLGWVLLSIGWVVSKCKHFEIELVVPGSQAAQGAPAEEQ